MNLYMSEECRVFKEANPEAWDSFGCGPGGIGDWLVPDRMWGLLIVEACRIHDWYYRFSEDRSKEAWRVANKLMLLNTLKIVRAKTKRTWLRKLRTVRCYTYYVFVSSPFGWSSWQKA